MYFFPGNLSFLEIMATTTVVPKMVSSILAGSGTVSFAGCMGHIYVYILQGMADFILLDIMSFEHYQAICKPLRYETIINNKVCTRFILFSWTGGFLTTLYPIIFLTKLNFGGPNTIDHFFCDSWPLLKPSRSDTPFLELLDFILSFSSTAKFPNFHHRVLHPHHLHHPQDSVFRREAESFLHLLFTPHHGGHCLWQHHIPLCTARKEAFLSSQ